MKHKRGYVLLTVLLLLSLAAVALASVCRRAVQKSLQASASSDELQRRWGAVSCRYTLLPNAENLLDDIGPDGTPLTRVHAELQLTSTQFSLDLCDEQSKVNVNTIFLILGKARAEQAAKLLVSAGGGGMTPSFRLTVRSDVRPKPLQPQQAADPDAEEAELNVGDRFPSVFGSLSEIFPGAGPSDLFPNSRGSVTTNLTCWGDGRLNVRRASLASLAQMCSPVLSTIQIQRLVTLRNQLGDNVPVSQLLAAVHTPTSDAFTLSKRLSVTSATHSLWIVARDRTATSRELVVRDASDSDDVKSFSFQW